MRLKALSLAILALTLPGCSGLADNVLSAPVQTVFTGPNTPPPKPAKGAKVAKGEINAKIGDLCPKIGNLAITVKGVPLICKSRDGFRPRWKKHL